MAVNVGWCMCLHCAGVCAFIVLYVVLSWHVCCDKNITMNMIVHTLYIPVPPFVQLLSPTLHQ